MTWLVEPQSDSNEGNQQPLDMCGPILAGGAWTLIGIIGSCLLGELCRSLVIIDLTA